VCLFHAFAIHALTTGLAQKVIEVVHTPVETKVIAEVDKPPPPAEIVLPPPRFEAAPPPPFIPPPEVHIAAPPVQNTITAITSTPPPVPVTIAPIAPPVVAAPPAPPAPPARVVSPPAPVSAAVVCSNYAAVMGDAAYPRDARRAGIDKGEVLIQFTLAPSGQIKDIRVIRASHPIFARNSVRIVSEYKCHGQDHDVPVLVSFGYKLE
jgi:protein TonB